MGPYCVIHQTQGGAYVLAEMDRAIFQHYVAAYRLLPYIQWNEIDKIVSDLNISSELDAKFSSGQMQETDNQDPQSDDSDGSGPD